MRVPGGCWSGWLLACLLAGSPALAHEVRPGYLELRELSAAHWDVLWKVPVKNNLSLAIDVQLPDDCVASDRANRPAAGAQIERWRAECRNDLLGRQIRIDGLERLRTDVLARVIRSDGNTQTVRLTPANTTFMVVPAQSGVDVARAYGALGIEHILIGIDHLLFVLALLLLVSGWRRLLLTITAFTLGHTLTLTAATLGWVNAPVTLVEALIALSIVFVSVEIVYQRRGHAGPGARLPALVAGTFGLLHGLGFAAALRELGLPEQAIPLALASFNVGVELGQVLFITAVFGLLHAIRMTFLPVTRYRDTQQVVVRLAVPGAYLTGTLGMFWVFERMQEFWA